LAKTNKILFYFIVVLLLSSCFLIFNIPSTQAATLNIDAPLEFPNFGTSNSSSYNQMVNGNYSAYFKTNSNTPNAVMYQINGYNFSIDISTSQLHYCANSSLNYAIIGMQTTMNPLNTNLSVSSNQATYQNAWTNSDLIFSASTNQLKENIVNRGISPSSNPGLTSYLEYAENLYYNNSLTLYADGVGYLHPSNAFFNTNGTLNFNDASNKTQFYFPQPIIFDSTGQNITGIYRVSDNNGVAIINILISLSWIKQAVFPIYIDPTTNTIGGTTLTGAISTGNIFGFPITASATGTLTTVGFNIPSGHAAGNIRLAIYNTYSASKFSGLLGQSASTVAVNGWNDLSCGTEISITSGHTYYIAVQASSSSCYFYYISTGNMYDAAMTYGVYVDPSVTLTADTLTINMRMTYTTTSTYSPSVTSLLNSIALSTSRTLTVHRSDTSLLNQIGGLVSRTLTVHRSVTSLLNSIVLSTSRTLTIHRSATSLLNQILNSASRGFLLTRQSNLLLNSVSLTATRIETLHRNSTNLLSNILDSSLRNEVLQRGIQTVITPAIQQATLIYGVQAFIASVTSVLNQISQIVTPQLNHVTPYVTPFKTPIIQTPLLTVIQQIRTYILSGLLVQTIKTAFLKFEANQFGRYLTVVLMAFALLIFVKKRKKKQAATNKLSKLDNIE
jgi:hypothetical protein